MTNSELRNALHDGTRVYGTCVLSTSPKWPEMISRTGVDFVFIDTEHTPIGRETLSWMCQTYRALGIPPIVRIPLPNPYWATMARDAGAAGIIVPYVETVDEVQDLRGALRFAPLKGRRLAEALESGVAVNEHVTKYLAKANDDRIMILNIESVPAIDALDDLLAVPGVDGLLIGPHDLSINLGVPEEYSSPIFIEAINTIFRKAREHNVGGGVHFFTPRIDAVAAMKAGANLIIHGSDISMVGDMLTSDLAQLRGAMGDASTAAGGDTVV